MVNFSLEGKIALITGASYGIGFAIATAYAEAGATIVFNDIKQELVDKGLAAYKEQGIDAHGYVCDVTDEDAVNEFIAKIEKEIGVIDILVNNAGIIKRIPMIEMKADFLLEEDKKGKKRPYRTYMGPVYKGGFSDHLPVFIDLIIK
jgi:gluconate 5-dehydrogenase